VVLTQQRLHHYRRVHTVPQQVPGQRDDRVVTFTFIDTVPDELTPVAKWTFESTCPFKDSSLEVSVRVTPGASCSLLGRLGETGVGEVRRYPLGRAYWDGLTPAASRRDRAFWQERATST
jgi:hypothetical protein